MKQASRPLSVITLLYYLLIFAGTLTPLVVLADESGGINKEKKEIPKMEEVVVTATRIEEPLKDVSASVQIISGEDIANSKAKDAGDLIAEAGVGHITKYGSDLTGSIELRGLSTDLSSPLSSRVLVLVNGNNAGTVNLAKMPVEDIEKIEIVKGPGSVLYGSSAMGGVINIITKSGKGPFHGSVSGDLGSARAWKTAAEVGGKHGAFDYFASMSRSSRDDFSAGNGKVENSAYYDESLSTRFGYELFKDNHATFGYQHWRGYSMGSPGAGYSPDPDNYSNKKRDAFDLGFKLGTLDAKYYLTEDREVSHGGMTSGIGNGELYETNKDGQGFSIQKALVFGDHRVIVGGQWDRMDISNRRNTGAPYNPDSRYDSFGAFTEGRVSLFNKKLLINGGIRYDYFENEILSTLGITSVIPKKENLDHITVRGGAVYKLTNDLSFKGNIGTAYRAPAPLELAADYLMWGTHYVGNPDLNPEKSTSYDVGVDYSKGQFRGGLAFFHTDFKNKIVSYYDRTRFISTYKNVDGATLQGIELNASYDIGAALGWKITIEPFTNITYKTKREQKNDDRDTTLLNIPKWTGAFGVKIGQANWDARLIANYTGNEKTTDWDYSSPTYGDTIHKANFTVFHLKGSYRVTKAVELTASVENLFDKTYAYSLGYPMPGRTIIGGVKWLFK